MPCLMLVACIYLCHLCNDANLMQTQFYLYLFGDIYEKANPSCLGCHDGFDRL